MIHAKFQDHRISGSEKFFNGFGNIWVWQPSWSCDQVNCNKFMSPFPSRLQLNSALTGQVISEKMMFENNGHINVYSPVEAVFTKLC